MSTFMLQAFTCCIELCTWHMQQRAKSNKSMDAFIQPTTISLFFSPTIPTHATVKNKRTGYRHAKANVLKASLKLKDKTTLTDPIIKNWHHNATTQCE